MKEYPCPQCGRVQQKDARDVVYPLALKCPACGNRWQALGDTDHAARFGHSATPEGYKEHPDFTFVPGE